MAAVRCLGLALLLFTSCALAAPSALPAVEDNETLDSLMARRLAPDNTFVALQAPRTLRLRGSVDRLPAPGKTQYMTESLAMLGLPALKVSNKMWLRSARGERVMVYVADEVAERIKGGSRAGADITVIALYLWNSRHGPGLLVTDVKLPPAGSWPVVKTRVGGWFGVSEAGAAR